MFGISNTISISVLADVAKARRGIESVDRQLTGFGKTTKKLGGLMKGAFIGLAAGVAGTAAVSFLKDSIGAASDLNETISKTKTIFGKASPDILKFGKNAATSLGISTNEALTGVSTFGNFFNQLGFGVKQSAAMSKGFVRMSSDLASFNNANPAEVMDALSSATRGEYDSLQKFIPTINAAAVQQKAMSMTGKTNAKALTDQEKASALYQLALKGQGKAAGDFQRTSGGLANQQRILKAQFENLKATIGQALLPVVLAFVKFLNTNFIPAMKAVGNFLGPVIAKVKEFFQGFKSGHASASGVSSFFKTQLIPAVQDVIRAYQGFFNVVVPIVRQVSAAVLKAWRSVSPETRSTWKSIKEIIVTVLQIAARNVRLITRIIALIWKSQGANILRTVTGVFKGVAKVISGVMKIIAGIVKLVLNVMRGNWKGAWAAIKQIVSGALSVIKGLVRIQMSLMRGIMTAAWAAVRAAARAAWAGIRSAVSAGINNVVSTVRGLPGRIRGALAGASTWLFGVGQAVMSGLINGIRSMVGALISAAGGVVGAVISAAKNRLESRSPSRVFIRIGQDTMKGLQIGLKDTSGVERAIVNVADAMTGNFNPELSALAPAGAAGTGTNYFQITVNAPVGSNPADIGRTITYYVDQYEKAGGRRRA